MVKIDHVPEDVQWVWVIQSISQPVGIDTLIKIREIIKANSKFFPWETKYDSIPKEVHDAYYKKKNAVFDEIWQEKRDSGYKGLIPTLMDMDRAIDDTPTTAPQKTFIEIMANLFEMEANKTKREREQYEKDKAMWDEFYKPYGLEYRK